MGDAYGIQVPGKHDDSARRPPPRYLVVVESPGEVIALLFLESRELVAEVSASAEDVMSMIEGLQPSRTALLPEWDAALAGHTKEQRAAADVYVLDHPPKPQDRQLGRG